MQVFEYVDVSSATAEAVTLDSEESLTSDEADWNGTPRFFQVRNVILLYVGNNQEIVTKMEAAFGPPFAGG